MKSDPKRKRKRATTATPVRPTVMAGPAVRIPWRADWLRGAAAAALLIALVVVTYAPTLGNKYIWDDDAYVTKNLNLRSPQGLWATWFEPFSLPQYYPLVHTTFWLEYQSSALDPWIYHLDNMLLHALAVVLAWRVLLKLGIPWSWLGAALFAVHPVIVESVAWITERKNVLSEVLALASMLCYLRFAPLETAAERSATDRWKWVSYAFSFFFFVGALLSKTVVSSLPAVLLVIYWWKRGRIGWRDVVPLVPFFAVGISLGLVTAWLERIHVGAEGEDWSFTHVERVLIAGRAVWFYATKLAWPWPVIFFYPRWEIDSHAWWQYLFPLGAVALVVALWMWRGRLGRGPLAAALIFGGVLFPALGFLNVYPFRYSFVADHFQHHATLAFFALAAAGAGLLDRRLASREASFATAGEQVAEPPWTLAGMNGAQVALRVAVAAVLAVLSAISFRQCSTYYNVETLYTDIIAKNPRCWVAYSNLGAFLINDGRSEQALSTLKQALDIAPDNSLTHANYGRALYDRGVREGFQPGQLDEALAHFQEALRLEPRLMIARIALAQVLIRLEREAEAEKYLQSVLERMPNNPQALTVMGSLKVVQKQWAAARDYFQQAIDYKPGMGDAQHGLGMALLNLGDFHEAISHLQVAAQLKPESHEVHYLLGNALYNLGDFRTSIDQYNEALRIKPDDLDSLSNLGVAYGQAGMKSRRLEDADHAIRCFERLVKLNAQYNGAQTNLNNSYELKKLLQEKQAMP